MTATATPLPAATVAILAGGSSSRMGTDKSFVRVLGRPMVERVLDRVAGLGAETLLVTNRPDDYAYLGLPLYRDVIPESGALAGIYSALFYARRPHVLVVACDMPFLARPLLAHLLALAPDYDVVAPYTNDRYQPLHAVYSRRCLAPIRARLDAGRFKVTGFFEDVRVRTVGDDELRRYDPALRSFVNVNTPEEVAAAERDADQGDAGA
jgi:molybdopterin-guanine dinucleotide biosynthesis protein A